MVSFLKPSKNRVLLPLTVGLLCVLFWPWLFESDLLLYWRIWIFLTSLVCLLLGLLPSRASHFGTSVVAALAVYLGFSASPFDAWRGFSAIVILGLAVSVQPQRRRLVALWMALGTVLPLVLCVFVLARSHWTTEAWALARMLSGLMMGGAACLVILVMNEVSAATPYRRAAMMLPMVLIAAGLPLSLVREGHGQALPDWRVAARTIFVPPNQWTPEKRIQIVEKLETLRVAGALDAEYVWLTLALEENADLSVLKPVCATKAKRRVLSKAWNPWIQLGKLACTSAGMWPELGAKHLQKIADVVAEEAEPVFTRDQLHTRRISVRGATTWQAMLFRLQGDLLMDAGAVDAAAQAFKKAAQAGDTFALRDGVRALLDRNRIERAKEFSDNTTDPWIHLWLHADVEESTLWQAWNQTMRFDSLEPVARRGIMTTSFVGNRVAASNPTLEKIVASNFTYYTLGFYMQLPLPPKAKVPSQMWLLFRNRNSFRVNFVNTNGEVLTFACNTPKPMKDRTLKALPAHVCDRTWHEVHIEPAAFLKGPLQALYVQGQFDMAYMRAVP